MRLRFCPLRLWGRTGFQGRGMEKELNLGRSDVRGFGGIALRAFRHTQFQLPCGGLLLASQCVEQGKMALSTRYMLRVWGMVDTDFRLSAWLAQDFGLRVLRHNANA